MKLAIAVIHGMGSQREFFARPLIGELAKRFRDAGGESSDLAFQEIYWADVLIKREQALWDRVCSEYDLDNTRLRRFLINAFGDAIAYQPLKAGAKETQDVYKQIHSKIQDALSQLAQATRAGAGALLVILAHSLGSVIVSHYLWDLWQQADALPTPLERGETLAGLITFGSPLPLWSLRYENFGKPISFPHPKLKELYPKVSPQWLNFFDEDDVFAYPLRNLNSDYATVVSADVPISVGGLFTGWNPLSHAKYWTDDDFTKRVAELLYDIWRDGQS